MAMTTGLLTNAEIHWACVREPNVYSGKYEVEVHNLTKEQIDYINSFSVGKSAWTEVRTDAKYPEKGKFIKFRCAKPPRICDGQKNDLPEDVLIGNGTTANVLFLVSEPRSPQGVAKVKLTLNTIQVLKLVEYKADNLPTVKGEYSASVGKKTYNESKDVPAESEKLLDTEPLEEVN